MAESHFDNTGKLPQHSAMANMSEPVRMRMQCRDGTWGWFVIAVGQATYVGSADPEPSSEAQTVVKCPPCEAEDHEVTYFLGLPVIACPSMPCDRLLFIVPKDPPDESRSVRG